MKKIRELSTYVHVSRYTVLIMIRIHEVMQCRQKESCSNILFCVYAWWGSYFCPWLYSVVLPPCSYRVRAFSCFSGGGVLVGVAAATMAAADF